MSSGQYCKFCHHLWKSIREYEKHLACCEYFYHQRRNPPPEMDKHGIKLPSMREMFECVRDLTHRLEKTEKELARLKSTINCRQKRAILEWLNQSRQKPDRTFELWCADIKARESDMLKAIHGDLTEGIIACLERFVRQTNLERLPIRCFSQKKDEFYVYSSAKSRAYVEDPDNPDAESEPVWKRMTGDQMEKMAGRAIKSIRQEYHIWWNKSQFELFGAEPDEQRAMDKQEAFLNRLNGNHIAIETRLRTVKKWLFGELEENLRVVMDCDFE